MMKRVFFLCMALILFFVNSQGQTFPPRGTNDNSAYINTDPLSNVPLYGDYVYIGFYDDLCRMDLASPTVLDYVTSTGGSYIEIGDFDDRGILYFIDNYTNDAGLWSIDPQTENISYKGVLHGPDNSSFGTAVAVSYHGGVMYAIFSVSPYDVSASAVFTIDLNSGLCTRISANTFPGFFVSLAISHDGIFYGIDAEDGETGKLYMIDPEAGTRTLIGDTGLGTWSICGADFNDYTNELYFTLSYYDDGIYTIDTSTGVPSLVFGVGGCLCAVNSYSGSAVPFNYLYVIAAFVLIAGALVARKLFF